MNRRRTLELVRFLVGAFMVSLFSFGCSDGQVSGPLLLPEADASSQVDVSSPSPRTFVEDELTPDEQMRAAGAPVSFRVLGVSSTAPSGGSEVSAERYWQSAVFIAESLATYPVDLRRVRVSVHGEQVHPDTYEFIHAEEFIDACQLRREVNGVMVSVVAFREWDTLIFDLGSVPLVFIRPVRFQLYCSYRRLSSDIIHPIQVRFRVSFDDAETRPDVDVGGTRFQDSPIITVLPRSTKE